MTSLASRISSFEIPSSQNSVIRFLKSSEFASVVSESLHNEISAMVYSALEPIENKLTDVSNKLEDMENQLKLLLDMNAQLVSKLRQRNFSVDDREIASSLSEYNQSDSDQEAEKVEGERVLGTVRWFNVKHGYGFIEIENTKEEAFVHKSSIKKRNPDKLGCSLGDGEFVEFNIKNAEKGKEAVHVTGPNGTPVQGSVHDPKLTEKQEEHTSRTFRMTKYKSRYSSRQSLDTDSLRDDSLASRSSSRQSVNRDNVGERGLRKFHKNTRGRRRSHSSHATAEVLRGTTGERQPLHAPYYPHYPYPDYVYPYPPGQIPRPYHGNYMPN